VATDAEGTVYVLDAEAGELILFAPDGAYLRTISPTDAAIARARGLAVDAAGRIWVAHTPGQRLLAFSPAGALLAEIPAWPGAEGQVTDVAVTPDGAIFAVAMGINKLIEYDDQGARVGAWDVAPANTIDAPHLALVPGAAALYRTQPEESRIVRTETDDPSTAAEVFWQLPQRPEMVKPVGIAVASDGSLWITDVQGGRVMRLEIEQP
jgi:sugar lactone lactonase YvrE